MPAWFRTLFLQWIPWLLRMDRPGKKITRRSIYLQNKVFLLGQNEFKSISGMKNAFLFQMRELEKGDRFSKSLLDNVLDLEGDFILAPGGLPLPLSSPGSLLGIDNAGSSLPYSPTGQHGGIASMLVEKELHSILEEIKVITNKIRNEVLPIFFLLR